MTEFNHEPAGYQLCLFVGKLPEQLATARTVDVSPATAAPTDVLAAITASELSAADLRARTLVAFDATTAPALAVAVYAALCAFAGRRLDVLAGTTRIDPAPLLAAAASMHTDRSGPAEPVAQVGATLDGIPCIVLDHPLTSSDATLIRWSRRLRFVPASDLARALSEFIVIAGIRARPASERLPFLCVGDEVVGEDPLEPVGTDLDALRDAALHLRREHRSGTRDALVEVMAPSERDQHLAAAAIMPIEQTLSRLGARQNPDTSLWHCPRPSRHTHGDATASMRVQKEKVRCYRCDAERVDSLRLTMDVTGLSVDEAADWLLA